MNQLKSNYRDQLINDMDIQLPFSSYQYEISGKLSNASGNQMINYSNIQNCKKYTCKNNNSFMSNNIMNEQQLNHQNSIHSCFVKQTPANSKKSRHFFTADEDEKIKQLVKSFGTKNWNEVSMFMKGRTPKQCRDRYINYLIPGVFQGEWTNNEDEILIKMFNKVGPKWSVIKNFLPNRSCNAIKNRWNYYLNRNEISKKKEEIIIHSDEKNDDDDEILSNIINNSFDVQYNDFDYEINDNINGWPDFSDAEWI